MPEVAIEVAGLSKRFGDLVAVDDLSMRIEAGRVHGFIGPNGSGKTTAIRMFCGLLRPTQGSVTVLGIDVGREPDRVRRHVGYMTQRFSMYEDLTVAENFSFLGRIHGLGRARIRERTDALLESFELGPLAHKLVGPMSGGQKRRIALAASILTEPEILILDEPTSEVDPNTRREMWGRFFELADAGTTLLVSTHLMDEAERCHHLTVLDRGRKVADGAVDALERDLPATVLHVSGGDPVEWIPRLSRLAGVVALTQVGLGLRVLVDPAVADPRGLVLGRLPADVVVQPVAATIEDVFVLATRGAAA